MQIFVRTTDKQKSVELPTRSRPITIPYRRCKLLPAGAETKEVCLTERELYFVHNTNYYLTIWAYKPLIKLAYMFAL